MSTQLVGCFLGESYELIRKLAINHDVKQKIFESSINREMVMRSCPEDVKAWSHEEEIPKGDFTYSKRFKDFYSSNIDVNSVPEEFKIHYINKAKNFFADQHATLDLIEKIPKAKYLGWIDTILKESSDHIADKLEASYFPDLAGSKTSVGSNYKKCVQIVEDLKDAFAHRVSSRNFGFKVFKKPSGISYVRSSGLIIVHFANTIYFYNPSSLEVAIDCIQQVYKAGENFAKSYPLVNAEDEYHKYLAEILKISKKIDRTVAPFLGYAAHQAFASYVLEKGGVNRNIYTTFFDEAEDKVADYCRAFKLDYKIGDAKSGVSKLFNFLKNLGPDLPYAYELSLVFRGLPAPDMSKAHVIETCYTRTSSEHPYDIPDKKEYIAFCRKELYRAIRSHKKREIFVKGLVPSVEALIKAGTDPLTLGLDKWKLIKVIGNVEVPEIKSDPFSISKDSAIPAKYEVYDNGKAITRAKHEKNYLLNMASDESYHNTSLADHMKQILSGNKKITSDILQRVKYENVKMPHSARVFSEAHTDLRMTIAGIEYIARRILEFIPGNAMGKAPQDFFNYMYKMAASDAPIGIMTYVSYDLSKFGTRFNSELLRDFLNLLSEFTSIQNLGNIVDILHSGSIFTNERDMFAKYEFKTGNCEGFFNAVWTLEHICTMSYVAYKGTVSGLISGRIFLLTFSDDGTSAQAVNRDTPGEAVDALADHISKYYNHLGKSLNPLKVMINTSGFSFLNYLVAYKRIFPSGVKTTGKIHISSVDYLQGIYEEIDNLTASARGAVARGAHADIVFSEYMHTVYVHCARTMRGFKEAPANVKKYFISFPKSKYGLGVLCPLDLVGSIIKDRNTDCYTLCFRMNLAKKDCNFLASLDTKPFAKTKRSVVSNPPAANSKGVHAYLPIAQARLKDQLANSFVTNSIKSYLKADICCEEYLNWLDSVSYIPVRILEEYWDCTPSCVVDGFLGKLKNRNSYLAIIGYNSLGEIRNTITRYTKGLFTGFVNHIKYGDTSGNEYTWAVNQRTIANRGINVEGSSEVSIYNIIAPVWQVDETNVKPIKCNYESNTVLDKYSKDFELSGHTRAVCYNVSTSLSCKTGDPYVAIEMFEEVRGNIATAARAVRHLASSVCISQESRTALLSSIADWWGYIGSFDIDDKGHKMDRDMYKRYCISKQSTKSMISCNLNVAAGTKVEAPTLDMNATFMDSLIDVGRARLLTTAIFCLCLVHRLIRLVPAELTFSTIILEKARRKIDSDAIDNQVIRYTRTASYGILPFSPFDVEISYKNFFDEKMRAVIGNRDMVPLAMATIQNEDTGGIIVNYTATLGFVAPIIGLNIRQDILPALCAAYIICYSSRAAYDWNMREVPFDDLPDSKTGKAYFERILREYSNKDLESYLSDRLKSSNLPEAIVNWIYDIGFTRKWIEVLTWIDKARHGQLQDCRNIYEAGEKLGRPHRIVYDLTGLIREMVRIVCMARITEPINKESMNTTKFGKNEAFAINRIRDTHNFLKLDTKYKSSHTGSKMILSVLDEACFYQKKKAWRSHGFEESNVYAIRKALRVASACVSRLICKKNLECIKEKKSEDINDHTIAYLGCSIIQSCAKHAVNWVSNGRTRVNIDEAESILSSAVAYCKEMYARSDPEAYEENYSNPEFDLVFDTTRVLKGEKTNNLVFASKMDIHPVVNSVVFELIKNKSVFDTYLLTDLKAAKYTVAHDNNPAIASRIVIPTEDRLGHDDIANFLEEVSARDIVDYTYVKSLKRKLVKVDHERLCDINKKIKDLVVKHGDNMYGADTAGKVLDKLEVVADSFSSSSIVRK
uniref:Putative RNA dependent RNA polymerase n=1 Tax=Thrips tabaci associated yue-like virus 1 TaxID=2771486 RepID=A0A7H1D356_9VIRU|nr:putative RNA dependent RNA polymerase [Thrips tabaci associated yue-like virus 1]